ncbi:hypothetical protein [Trichothermofontia sp.]
MNRSRPALNALYLNFNSLDRGLGCCIAGADRGQVSLASVRYHYH